jgi:5-methylcytosine-specific restriction endonuclease McrA
MPSRIPPHRPATLPAPAGCEASGRPNAAARGYCDSRHRAWRLAVLVGAGWQCAACGRICARKGEAHADHVLPIAEGGARYEVANGQCLCSSCHSRKTVRENRTA